VAYNPCATDGFGISNDRKNIQLGNDYMVNRVAIAISIMTCLPIIAAAQSKQSPLANKTCRGTFHVPGPASETGLGALEHRFTAAGNVVSGQGWRLFGTSAYRKADGELITKTISNELTGFTMTGNLLDVVTSGKHVTYKSQNGSTYDLTLEGDNLTGTVDPRGVPGQEKWLVSDVRMLCHS
jgi:hypothetical protein